MESPVYRDNVRPLTPYRPPRRRRGCLYTVLFSGLMLFSACVFCSIGSLTLFFLFPPPPLDLLVLGLDARPDENYPTRTDSIVLVGVQPRGLRVSLLSLPRDLFIDVPGYGQQRINTINVLGEQQEIGGGVTLLSQSLAQNFNIQTDRYVRLNFQGFVELVNAVGGVTIDVPKRITDYAYPAADGGTISVTFEPGTEQMDGERALIYARTRHADSDYQRAERQQQVISAVAGKLLIPLYWAPALRVLNAYTETDLSVVDMARYAPIMLFRAGEFETLVVNPEYMTGSSPNYQKLEPWTRERFD